jgi:5-methylcytosine-specific restriction enzyme subunit McrC
VKVIDTKWKMIGQNPEDKKRGVSQSDVYQMMAYARLYHCREVMLLDPHHVGLGNEVLDSGCGMKKGNERLRIAGVDLVAGKGTVVQQLAGFILPAMVASLRAACFGFRSCSGRKSSAGRK